MLTINKMISALEKSNLKFKKLDENSVSFLTRRGERVHLKFNSTPTSDIYVSTITKSDGSKLVKSVCQPAATGAIVSNKMLINKSGKLEDIATRIINKSY